MGRSNKAQKPINAEKVKCDRRTDGRTDKAGCRVACTRLKNKKHHRPCPPPSSVGDDGHRDDIDGDDVDGDDVTE